MEGETQRGRAVSINVYKCILDSVDIATERLHCPPDKGS